MAFRNSTNGYHTDHAPADDDGQEYETLIVQGRGKLEGVSYQSDPAIEDAVRVILKQIGENPEREGLLKTPSRVAKMYAELTAGYHIDPARNLLALILIDLEPLQKPPEDRETFLRHLTASFKSSSGTASNANVCTMSPKISLV